MRDGGVGGDVLESDPVTSYINPEESVWTDLDLLRKHFSEKENVLPVAHDRRWTLMLREVMVSIEYSGDCLDDEVGCLVFSKVSLKGDAS